MTDILHSPSQLPSSSSSIATNNDGFHQQTHFHNHETLIINCNTDNNNVPVALYRRRNCTSREIQQVERGEEEEEEDQLSVLAVLLTVFRKSLVGCRNPSGENSGVEEQLMEIGCPTNVRHVAHVTFDRFNGFLGLPDEFEPEVPRRPPSASTRVFGVSTESMQLSFDSRGNCVPTILLMMQRRLYMQGGLQSEGIFRINPGNSQEEYVRQQLNNGVIPDNIDVHCLAGLIKAWFRELPRGVLDSLPPEQVMEAQSEDECAKLVRLLPPTEGALLDWAINLMADVAQLENFNKMNARNIAMVFAPNMTQMSDPLTALMFAVQVMNFLKTLIVKTLREREDFSVESGPMLQSEHSDEDDRYTISNPENPESNEISCEENQLSLPKEPMPNQTGNETHGFLSSIENILPDAKGADAADNFPSDNVPNSHGKSQPRSRRTRTSPHSNLNNVKKGSRKHNSRPVVHDCLLTFFFRQVASPPTWFLQVASSDDFHAEYSEISMEDIHDICSCGLRTKLVVSWYEPNAGRRFRACRRYGTHRACDHFDWFDPPLCTRAKAVIPVLLRKVNRLEAELKNKKTREIRLWMALMLACLIVVFMMK